MHYASLLYQNHANSKALEKEIIELLLTCGKEDQYLQLGKQFPFYENIRMAGITKGYSTCKQYFLDIIKQEDEAFYVLLRDIHKLCEEWPPRTPQGTQCIQEIEQAIEDREAYLKAEKERIQEEENRRYWEEREERRRQKEEAEEAERKKNIDNTVLGICLFFGVLVLMTILTYVFSISVGSSLFIVMLIVAYKAYEKLKK